MNIMIGAKYQRYVGEELEVLRLLKTNEEKTEFKLDNKGKKITLNKEELDKCIMLKPDAILNIVSAKTYDDKDDIYFITHKAMDFIHDIKTPVIVGRQNMSSGTLNKISKKYDMGICVVRFDNDNSINNLIDMNEIKYNIIIGLYVDDKMDDIINILNYYNNIDSIMLSIKDKYTTDYADGFCKSAKEFLTKFEYIDKFRAVFNIMQVDFKIELKNNVNDEGDITLNKKQIAKIEELLNCHIIDPIVLKYDKDLDVSKIVTKTHIMLSDKTEQIYLVAFISGSALKMDDQVSNAMLRNLYNK